MDTLYSNEINATASNGLSAADASGAAVLFEHIDTDIAGDGAHPCVAVGSVEGANGSLHTQIGFGYGVFAVGSVLKICITKRIQVF